MHFDRVLIGIGVVAALAVVIQKSGIAARVKRVFQDWKITRELQHEMIERQEQERKEAERRNGIRSLRRRPK
jgi:hypothetical protein